MIGDCLNHHSDVCRVNGAVMPNSRYTIMPVPAGISSPMMMFLEADQAVPWPSMAASVSTVVVPGNDVADSHDSVARQ